MLDDKSLWDLVNELYDQRTKWKRIGLGLSVPKSDLEAMSGNDDYDCLENMLSKWLKGINPPPSWERLVAVLCSKVVDEEKKAKEIEDKFCAVVISTTDGSSKALGTDICVFEGPSLQFILLFCRWWCSQFCQLCF